MLRNQRSWLLFGVLLSCMFPVFAAPTVMLESYVTGLVSPVAMANAGDTRLFVVERSGRIRIVSGDGQLRAAPFLDIRDRVKAGGEQGLLGLAFHPDYQSNGYFYVYYTRELANSLDRSRIARFSVASDHPDLADPDSEVIILEFEQPFANHNGGDVHFGPDGYLYIASGDGGSGGDPRDNAQNYHSLLGKLLRIDVDKMAGTLGPDCDQGGADGYHIPAENAFNDGVGGVGCDEIYASGLRNPWRFSFDRDTGDLWIGDVGQNEWEEIDFIAAGSAPSGLNFGWRCYEGNHAFNLSACSQTYIFPVYEFSHSFGDCSVTGGYVYRGSRYPQLRGLYLFTDYCIATVRALDAGDMIELAPSGVLSTPSAFGEDAAGELYVASLRDGIVYRIVVPAIFEDDFDDRRAAP